MSSLLTECHLLPVRASRYIFPYVCPSASYLLSIIKDIYMDTGQIFMNKASPFAFILLRTRTPSFSSTPPIPQSICFGGVHPLIKSLSFRFCFSSFCIIYLLIYPQLWADIVASILLDES